MSMKLINAENRFSELHFVADCICLSPLCSACCAAKLDSREKFRKGRITCVSVYSRSSTLSPIERACARPLSRIFQKIRLAEPYFRLISGSAEFLRKLRNSAEICPNTTNSASKADKLRQSDSIYKQHNKGV